MSDLVVQLVERAVRATLDGDIAVAVGALGAIEVTRPRMAPPILSSTPAAQPAAAREPRRPVPLATQLGIFRRDSFTCRYCGRATLFTPVVRVLSAFYPEALPFHPNWKFGAGHLLYWTHTASLEHIHPVAAGGTNDLANLATACYWCNDWKSNWTLEQLGWTLHDPVQSSWDGLAGQFPALYAAYAEDLGPEPPAYFRDWLRVVLATGTAEHTGGNTSG